jgi:imidazolonepropionase-like amidohydrolase
MPLWGRNMKRFLIFAVFLCLQIAGLFGQNQTMIAISGATLIDGTGRPPVPDITVIIAGDRITRVGPSGSLAIPPDARVIDGTGKFIVPGLIDTHVHLEMVGLADIGSLPAKWNTRDTLAKLVALNARLDLISGFTTVRDLGSTDIVLEVRNLVNSGQLLGPRIIASGMQLVKRSPEAPSEPMFLEYDGTESARTGVRRLAAIGVDVIKIRLTRQRPVPTLDEVRAIVQEAHHLGLRTTVHTDVPADDLVKLAMDAGADGIEHNAPLRSQDNETLARMARSKISLMAGAGAYYLQRIDGTGFIDELDKAQTRLFPADILSALRAGFGSLKGQTLQMTRSGWSAAQRQASFIEEIQRARKAGVLLVFGTDCGAYGMVHGEQYKALYGESRMGSSAMEAILMATRDAAAALGKTDELGTIEQGLQADLIIVDADPLKDLRNLHRIHRVIKGGSVYDPAELLASSKPGPSEGPHGTALVDAARLR